MRVLLQSVAQKNDFVSMGLLSANSEVIMPQTAVAPSGLGYVNSTANDMFKYRIGGNSFYLSDTSARQTVLDIDSPCVMTNILLPMFPRSVNAGQIYRVFIIKNGTEYTIDLINNENAMFGRMLGFNCGARGKYSPSVLETVCDSYAKGLGLICETSLKIDFQYVGLTRAEAYVGNTSNNEHKMHIAYKALDAKMSLLSSPTIATTETVSNLKDFN
ncbi:hypothetical protein NBRC116592_13000 [Colwellia sp. KU-HH00111]|mgnify:CR=1 FL=1|uniref:hypothetical protein n=1 Tax=Colwellia sp. KU-HH00111 TaxID=3127652 RepID=UPI0031099899